MGRRNKSYSKDLHQQAYERLTGMQAFGESKKDAMRDGTAVEKIFSFSTYTTYFKHIKYFISWVKENHPDCTTIKSAKKYVNDWLQARVEQVNSRGEHLSSWTIQTETAALCKLYRIDKADPDRFQPPKRERCDIKRSRTDTVRDKHFSKTNNAELIAFCKGTGCRRNVLEKLEGRDFWTRQEMEKRVSVLEAKGNLTEDERRDLVTMKDALQVFPKEDCFLHHRKDKNGRYRFAPIIGPDKQKIIARMKNTGANEKVWLHVSGNADIHGYRSEYATTLYKGYAREISKIPYDRVNRGTGRRFQGDVYVCRKDESGKKLDRKAMFLTSKALGHNRICIVADNYLRGL